VGCHVCNTKQTYEHGNNTSIRPLFLTAALFIFAFARISPLRRPRAAVCWKRPGLARHRLPHHMPCACAGVHRAVAVACTRGRRAASAGPGEARLLSSCRSPLRPPHRSPLEGRGAAHAALRLAHAAPALCTVLRMPPLRHPFSAASLRVRACRAPRRLKLRRLLPSHALRASPHCLLPPATGRHATAFTMLRAALHTVPASRVVRARTLRTLAYVRACAIDAHLCHRRTLRLVRRHHRPPV